MFEWAQEASGSRESYWTRGVAIQSLLGEEGTFPNARVLELGCGALSLGRLLIPQQAPGCYAAIEPQGWTVEVGLAQFPALESQSPRFLWNSSFDASELGVNFSFVVAHDLVSHFAHAQLGQMFATVREVVEEGAKFLFSYQRAEHNSWDERYAWEHTTTFRLETIQATALQNGWRAEPAYDWEKRLSRETGDELSWVRLKAVTPLQELQALEEEANGLRMSEEEVQDSEQQAARAARLARVAALEEEDA